MPRRARKSALGALRKDRVLDLRGVGLDDEHVLEEILAALPRVRGKIRLQALCLDHAMLETGMDLTGAVIEGHASFKDAMFGEKTWFTRTRFHAGIDFRGSTFKRDAGFAHAVFRGDADFAGAVFKGKAQFLAARFLGEVKFAGEREVTFEDWAMFREVRLHKGAWFGGARFESRTMFELACCSGLFRMEGAVLGAARTFGPMAAAVVDLDRVQFLAPIRLELSCNRLLLRGTHFFARSTLAVRRADVLADDVEFSRPSLLTASMEFTSLDRHGEERTLEEKPVSRPAQAPPRVLSLRQANVGELTMSGIDLRTCRFVGAHNLDQLRMESDCLLPAPPAGHHYTPRVTIADEHAWRDAAGKPGWWTEDVQPPNLTMRDWPPGIAPAQQVAAAYRDLRKGREDRSDAPGAADFYYGEMEMRRHSRPSPADPAARASPWGERALLTGYWLVSGYGLRATKAVAALVATIVVFAFALWPWGFKTDVTFWRALLFSAESTVSLFRVPAKPELTAVGEAIQLPLRLLGPLFFGLALLSLRGRVKR
jgi:uncharacterized protein YjbI with pentapeptide repeats